MDLQFPHHESEIAQSTICNHHVPARYWLHNNMITLNGKKMGKSYGNQIRLTEMFTGNHPILERGYSPMTIRFFILQTHYRSTLDFSNDALQAAEKGLKRLWEAYRELMKLEHDPSKATEAKLEEQFYTYCREFDEFMSDDFNTAKVLANMFTLVNHINSLKSGALEKSTLSAECYAYVKQQFKVYLEDIFGLKEESSGDDSKLTGVVELLIDIRRDARQKKDYATSDKIRNQLLQLGVVLKDEKDGGISYSFA
jgi:cysteinyl-tRNA synthetase